MLISEQESPELNLMFEMVESVIEKEKRSLEVPTNINSVQSSKILEALRTGENGDGRLFADLYRDKFCYDQTEKRWYRYNSVYWQEDVLEDAFAAVDEVVDLYEQEVQRQLKIKIKAIKAKDKASQQNAEENGKALLRRIEKLQDVYRRNNVLTFASSGSKSLALDGTRWDSDPWLLGCKNGVIDLRTGRLIESIPEYYIRTAAPTEWKGLDEPAPVWEHTLEEIFNGDKEVVAFIQRLFGSAIIGKVIEHILSIFCGYGRNGKSMIFEVLGHVLGPLAGPLQGEMLLEQSFTRSSSSPSPDIVALRGLRVAWANEISDGRSLNSGKAKSLVGGDTLVGRLPHAKRQTIFKPTHTLFLITNHKPHAHANDYALWHRINVIPFKLSFVKNPKADFERKVDLNLQEKLQQEASGILAWLVRGCLLWQKEKMLNPPKAIIDDLAPKS